MRLLAATAMALVFTACLTIAATSSKSFAAGGSARLAPGDQLVYEITVELQQHHTTKGPQPKDKAQESSAQGTETFTVYSIGNDGVAFANVDASFQGAANGKPFQSHTTMAAKVMPDGRLQVNSQLGLGISEAMSFANATVAELGSHALRAGAAWTSPQSTQFVRLTLARKVAGVSTFQGSRAFEVQTLGSGDLLKTSDGIPAAGTVAISGTTYYDAQHRLFIGEALRTLTVVQRPDSQTTHDNYAATMNIVLSSWTHGPKPQAPAPQTGAETQASPAAQITSYPSPAAAPSNYGATPYPTVTPRLGP